MQVSNLCSYAIDPRKFAPNCFVSIKLKIVLQNNFLPILHPEELDCAKLSTQAKDYSGLENDRGNYFVAVKEMNRSLTPVHCFFSFKFGATAAGSISLRIGFHQRNRIVAVQKAEHCFGNIVRAISSFSPYLNNINLNFL